MFRALDENKAINLFAEIHSAYLEIKKAGCALLLNAILIHLTVSHSNGCNATYRQVETAEQEAKSKCCKSG